MGLSQSRAACLHDQTDLAKGGLQFETEHGRADLHALRVTFCTNLLNAGVHPRVVQELMRHSDIKLTMKVCTDPSQLPLAAALEALPALSLPTPASTPGMRAAG